MKCSHVCVCVCREAGDCTNDAEPASQTPPAGAVNDTSDAEPASQTTLDTNDAEPASQTPLAGAVNDTSDAEPASQTPPTGADEDK